MAGTRQMTEGTFKYKKLPDGSLNKMLFLALYAGRNLFVTGALPPFVATSVQNMLGLAHRSVMLGN